MTTAPVEVTISKLIKKVFSQNLAKSYYISTDYHPTVKGLPCFTERELVKIKEWMGRGEMDFKAVDWLYNMKLEDWRYEAFPKEPYKIPEREADTRSEEVKRAQSEFFSWLENNFRKPVAGEENK